MTPRAAHVIHRPDMNSIFYVHSGEGPNSVVVSREFNVSNHLCFVCEFGGVERGGL
jgi:hypothetical protein